MLAPSRAGEASNSYRTACATTQSVSISISTNTKYTACEDLSPPLRDQLISRHYELRSLYMNYEDYGL
eukprot:1194332-Prorocentrum_minimum.AAC.5